MNVLTIQEMTLQAHEFGIIGFLTKEQNFSREAIFTIIQKWAEEFDEGHKGYDWCGDYYDEIDDFLMRKKMGFANKYIPNELHKGSYIEYDGGLYRVLHILDGYYEVETINGDTLETIAIDKPIEVLNMEKVRLSEETDWEFEYGVYAINRDTRIFENTSCTEGMTMELYKGFDESDVSRMLADRLRNGGDNEFTLYNYNHELVGFVYCTD